MNCKILPNNTIILDDRVVEGFRDAISTRSGSGTGDTPAAAIIAAMRDRGDFAEAEAQAQAMGLTCAYSIQCEGGGVYVEIRAGAWTRVGDEDCLCLPPALKDWGVCDE